MKNISKIEYILPLPERGETIGQLLLESIEKLMEKIPCEYAKGLVNVDEFNFLTIKPDIHKGRHNETITFKRISMTEIFADDLFVLLENIVQERYCGKSKSKLLRAIKKHDSFNMDNHFNSKPLNTKTSLSLRNRIYEEVKSVFNAVWSEQVDVKNVYVNGTYNRSIKMFNILKKNGVWVVYINVQKELVSVKSLTEKVDGNADFLKKRNHVFIGKTYKELVLSEAIKSIEAELNEKL